MPFYYPIQKLDLGGKLLLLPVVSTANVSQLAVDLVISSLGLQLVGAFDPKHVVPVVGARDDGQQGITTPLELYGKDGVDVVVIQQRSPALKDRKQEFVQDVLDFIQKTGFSAVLLLSGVDMSDRTDTQMITPTYQIRPSNTPAWESTPLNSLTQLPIPKYTSPVQATDEVPFIPGGGLTRRILSSLPHPWTTPIASLLQFVLEGDNRGDARLMASVVAKVLNLDVSNGWKEPKSWERGLFGTPHDQTLYG